MGKRAAILLAAVVAIGVVQVAEAVAREIGVTSAVLPNARGTPPNQDTRILQVGTDMFADERVQTVENGKVHLLFLDGSAMSIGPNSDLVLDQFVYDPDSKTGNMAFSATKGVFRFVGGRISKTSPITIRTPTATIGVRGGVALITIGDIIRATLIYGEELFITAGGITRTVNKAGFELRMNEQGEISQPIAADSDALGEPLDQLEGDPSQTQETRDLITEADVAGSQLSSLGSSNAPAAVAPSDVTAPPAPTAAEAERSADLAGSTEANRGQDNPDAGGGGVAPAAGLTGMYLHADDRTFGTDLDSFLDEDIVSGNVGNGRYQGMTEFGSLISYPVSTTPANDGTPGSGSYLDYGLGSGTSSVFGPMEPGRSFVADSGEFTFAFADETDFAGHGVFVYAGIPTLPGAYPAAGIFRYALQRDLFLNGDIPFTAALFGGQIGLPGDTIGNAYINWQANGSGEKAFVAANAGFVDAASMQKSAVTVMVGHVREDADIDDDDVSLDLGRMRGSVRADTDAMQRTLYLGSGVETKDSADGFDFFGSTAPNFFVLDSSDDDNFNPASDNGVDTFVGTTPGVTVVPNVPGLRQNDPVGLTRTPRALVLETGGISADWTMSGTQAAFRRFISNGSGNSMLTLNADGSMSAAADVVSLDGGLVPNAILRFGGHTGNSAFVADGIFAAIESDTPSDANGSAVASQVLYFMTLEGVRASGALPADFELCECAFLTAGFWGGQVRTGATSENDFHLSPWVAGPPIAAADFPTSGNATYAGNVLANVFDSGVLYTTAGTFSAGVSFAPGMVTVNTMSIAADGAAVNMAGSGATPGPIPVVGNGSRGADALVAVGSARFAGTNMAENIFGSYAAENSAGTYRQAGVFGGDRQ